jgi:hypothetical protein
MKTNQLIKQAEKLIKRDNRFFAERFEIENHSRKLLIDKIRTDHFNDKLSFADAKLMLDYLSFDIVTNIDYSLIYSYYNYPPLKL